jgi:hypothetical protein
MSSSMENSFAEGDFVEVPATYFDDTDDEASGKTPWSVEQFGTAAGSTMCKGQIVEKKRRQVWAVRFPDGTFDIHSSWLSSAGLPEVPEAQKQKKRTWQEVEGDIDFSDEESEEEEISTYNAPAGVFKQVEGSIVWSDVHRVPLRDPRHRFVKEPYQNPELLKLPPRVNSAHTLFDLWLLWADKDFMQVCVTEMNRKGQAKYHGDWKTLTLGRYITWLGLWVQMLANPIAGERRTYWTNKKDYKCWEPHRASFSSVMGILEFERIYQVFGVPSVDPEDPFDAVRLAVDKFNDNAAAVWSPGFLLVVDETMHQWLGGECPGKTVVPRKPIPVGIEFKTTCCALSKIIIRLDPQEGALNMMDKECNLEWGTKKKPGKSTGCTLRLVKPWWNTGRIVLGDSWFGSLKTAIALLTKGLFCILNIKTGHAYFPKTILAANISKENREHCRMATVTLKTPVASLGESKFEVMAAAQREKNPLLTVATCETMQPGKDRVLTTFAVGADGVSEKTKISFPTTKIHGMYRTYFNGIDLHNRVRQQFMHFTTIWGTHCWANRVLGEIWGMTLTNTFFHAQSQYTTYADIDPQSFKEQIAYQMMFNPFVVAETAARPRSILKASGNHVMDNLPPRANNPKKLSDTACRYCEHNTSHFCRTCSGETFYIGVCDSGIRGCWAKHCQGEPFRSRKKHRWTKTVARDLAVAMSQGE